MPRIELVTEIRAPPERCFDLSRDVDLHLESMASSRETAIAGRACGLLGLGDEVTWQARHFGLVHRHRARITAFNRPAHFRDSMVAGRFARFEHDHYFEPVAGGTRMRDVVEFVSPYGILGRLVDTFILAPYLRRLIEHRNRAIRSAAEESQEGR